jgi:hypothetical protein
VRPDRTARTTHESRHCGELFPAEQARIVRLLVQRVDVAPDHIAVRLRVEGLRTLVAELGLRKKAVAA